MLKSPSLTSRLHRIPILVLIAIIAALCFIPAPRHSLALQGTAPVPFRASDDPWLIRDDARLFNEDQMNRFQFDLRRLQGLGENVMVYTRRSDASREDSEGFARRLREAWRVESAPGADDGLVMLITISTSNPRGSTFVLSPGSNFFPIGQMDSSDLDHVYEEEIEPNFHENRYDVALAYGLRRVLYAADYTPPAPPALTGVQAFAHEVGKTGGPVLLQAALFGLAVGPALMERRLTTRPSRRTVLAHASIFGPAAVLLALFSVIGRSGMGMVTALLVLALIIAVTTVVLKRRAETGSGVQPIRVESSSGRSRRRLQRHKHHRRDRYAPQT